MKAPDGYPMDAVAEVERERFLTLQLGEYRALLERAAAALEPFEPQEPATSVRASINAALDVWTCDFCERVFNSDVKRTYEPECAGTACPEWFSAQRSRNARWALVKALRSRPMRQSKVLPVWALPPMALVIALAVIGFPAAWLYEKLRGGL